MMYTVYAGSASKARLIRMELLPKEKLIDIARAPTVADIIRILNGTPYEKYISDLSSRYTSFDMLDLSATKKMLATIIHIMDSPPPTARDTLKAYLSRWDFESIKAIITSKFLGTELKENDIFIVDRADFPVGSITNLISREEYRMMINEFDIEGIAKFLVKLGYGSYLLYYLDEFRKENDISILLYALDVAYFQRLIDCIKFYNGDEGPVRHFIKEEVDIKNLETLLKGSRLNLDYQSLKPGIINSGNIDERKLSEIYGTGQEDELKNFISKYFGLDGEKIIKMTPGEIKNEMERKTLLNNLQKIGSQANSLGAILYSIKIVENERNNLRKIFAGKQYGKDISSIENSLIMV